jgi:hypothetical protein
VAVDLIDRRSGVEERCVPIFDPIVGVADMAADFELDVGVDGTQVARLKNAWIRPKALKVQANGVRKLIRTPYAEARGPYGFSTSHFIGCTAWERPFISHQSTPNGRASTTVEIYESPSGSWSEPNSTLSPCLPSNWTMRVLRLVSMI